MSDDQQISRRTALKVIAVGVGTTSALPLLEETAFGQHRHPREPTGQMPSQTLRFFNAQELATIAVISELIIPEDEHSPGTRSAGVADFIDLMVSESSAEVKTLWRDGVAAIDRLSKEKYLTAFSEATHDQQVSLLKSISKAEYKPKTIEERFFVAIKGMTVDGYYTSQVGIHQDLRYKGNAYLKDFVGCNHPEHLS